MFSWYFEGFGIVYLRGKISLELYFRILVMKWAYLVHHVVDFYFEKVLLFMKYLLCQRLHSYPASINWCKTCSKCSKPQQSLILYLYHHFSFVLLPQSALMGVIMIVLWSQSYLTFLSLYHPRILTLSPTNFYSD